MADATLTKVKIQPLGDRVLVKPVEQKETKRGGIIIPDTAKEKPQEGEVIAVGKGNPGHPQVRESPERSNINGKTDRVLRRGSKEP